MRTRKTVVLAGPVILCIIMALTMAGCSQVDVTKAAQIVKDASITLKAVQDAEVALHNAGSISTDEHKAIQAGIAKAATALSVANDAVLHAKDAATAKQAVAVAAQAGTELVNSLNLIKNPTAKAGLQAAVVGLQAILAAI
jgi:hypothetical protein